MPDRTTPGIAGGPGDPAARSRVAVRGSKDATLPPADLIVDALIGYSLRGTPSGRMADLPLRQHQVRIWAVTPAMPVAKQRSRNA
jgi:NAD(P)H-hydrate repair Nnr-like enzyme with NAD(P)H-hydrate epimerase domain